MAETHKDDRVFGGDRMFVPILSVLLVVLLAIPLQISLSKQDRIPERLESVRRNAEEIRNGQIEYQQIIVKALVEDLVASKNLLSNISAKETESSLSAWRLRSRDVCGQYMRIADEFRARTEWMRRCNKLERRQPQSAPSSGQGGDE